jgi:hypothetical protein
MKLNTKSSWISRLRFSALFVVTVFFAPFFVPFAAAQIIDQIDVAQRGNEAEIAIQFSTTVQYVRHQPATQGSLLQIEFKITGQLDAAGSGLISETRRSPQSELVAPFEVSYDNRTKLLTVKFSRFTAYAVRPGSNPNTISIFVPTSVAEVKDKKTAGASSVIPPIPAALPATGASNAVDEQAASLLTQAKGALATKDASKAIDVLNRLLNLPPNRVTQEAQELAGQARELSGETAKARAEYDLYLRLYPTGPDVDRVKQRLAGLGKVVISADGKTVIETKPEFSFFGSVSSYYYNGSSKYDATLAPPLPGLTFSQISLTSTDQSALITNIDLNGRYRTAEFDTKIVVRDTRTDNFLSGQKDTNRLNNAYVETLYKPADLFARIGRQSATGYGVLNRFDGAWLRYGFNKQFKLNVLLGEPVEFYAVPKKKFAATAVDIGPFAESFSGNIFAVEQRVDGKTDRRAVGGEVRYLDAQKNGFVLADYDIDYKSLNILLAQGNWTLKDSTSFNILFDRRRTPILQLTNGLSVLPFRTVRENLDNGGTLDDIKFASRAVTPLSNLFSIGVTHPLTPQWQLGADFKISDVSGTREVGTLPAQPGTGNIYVYAFQALRTGFLSVNDIVVFSASLINGKTYDGQSYQLSHVIQIQEKWRLESLLKYYRQKDKSGLTLDRLAPTIRLSYRLNDHFSVESEIAAEWSKSTSALQDDKTNRRLYNIGLRYDFF